MCDTGTSPPPVPCRRRRGVWHYTFELCFFQIRRSRLSVTLDVRPKEKVPLKRASGLRGQIYHVPRKYPQVTPKSEARSEISVKFGMLCVLGTHCERRMRCVCCARCVCCVCRAHRVACRVCRARRGRERRTRILTSWSSCLGRSISVTCEWQCQWVWWSRCVSE